MTHLNTEKTLKAEDMLYVLHFATGELCKLAKANKDSNTGIMFAAAALIQKLEHDIEKTEKRMKTDDKEFYSLS